MMSKEQGLANNCEPQGVGRVFWENKEWCTVSYRLRISKSLLASINHTEELEEAKVFYGIIYIIEGERELLGKERLVLYLDNGKTWSFRVLKASNSEITFDCENSDGRGIV